MKQLILLSGKGGTGKTSITAAFAHLSHTSNRVQAVLADADVDASNMELVLAPEVQEQHEFVGGAAAFINADMCIGCGVCAELCRFDAIAMDEQARQQMHTRSYRVDAVACEGCAACFYQCPANAIQMVPQVAGHWFRSQSRYGMLFHAALHPAQENSGKLVTLVKQQARLLALDEGYNMVLVDGPPGIGCPVISAAAGADLALIVTEPTSSGLHDLQRILETTAHFRVPALVCINKADLYPEGAQHLQHYCEQHHIEVVGHIPFDEAMQQAMIQGQPVTAWRPEAPISRAIVALWQRVVARLTALEG